jgi:hypothetical protein
MHEPAIPDRTLVNVGRVPSYVRLCSKQRVVAVLPSEVDTFEPRDALNVTDIVILSLFKVGIVDHGLLGESCVEVLQFSRIGLDIVENVSRAFDSVVGVLAVIIGDEES